MLSSLDSSYYTSEDVFRRERELLFGRLWQFFTLKNLVARHNAFVTRNLLGHSIVVQNFHGEIRAFENTCLHRQAALQWESEGVRPLVCRYHAWGYDVGGRVANIPSEDLYRFSRAERQGMCLRSYPVTLVGNLVFVCLSADPVPLEEQFSPAFIESLRASSESYDGEVAVTTFRGRYNWKLAYENLRDAHHPRFVHAKTLSTVLTFTPGIFEGWLADARALRAAPEPIERGAGMELMRRFSYVSKDAEIAELQPLEWHRFVERWQQELGYFNWLTFPNLHIAAPTGGHAFTIEHHIPVSAGVTDLVLYWVTGRRTGPYEPAPAVLYSRMIDSQRVLAEDIEVMERVQSQLHQDSPRAMLGDYESVTQLVQAWYARVMEGHLVL